MDWKKTLTRCFFVALLSLWAATGSIFAQADSVKISLLTCSPGAQVYSTYGHSALRVVDYRAGTDIVYNWGVFDFETPNFLVKFIKGNLLYKLNTELFRDFVREYQRQGRSVIEQELDITPQEKQHIQAFIANNLKPENQYYLYDFFFDNCSTRIRDLFDQVLDIEYPNISTEPKSFRDYLAPYHEGKAWYHFGTNLILGLPTDDAADYVDAMFLPEELSKNLSQATINGHPFLKEGVLLTGRTSFATAGPNYPLWTMLGVFLLAVVISFFGPKWLQASFDVPLFLAAVLAGFLFIFMWTSTQHQVCYQNMNLLWGNPAFILLPFLFKFTKNTWRWVALFLAGVLLLWLIYPQELPIEIVPFVGAMLVRSGCRANFNLPFKSK